MGKLIPVLFLASLALWCAAIAFHSLGLFSLRTRPKQRMSVLSLLNEHSPRSGLELVARSDGVLRRGTVYIVLSELLDEGCVTAEIERVPPSRAEISVAWRCVYRITNAGRMALTIAFATTGPGDANG
jgi:DNA-binding PadR family transcriptional regulator